MIIARQFGLGAELDTFYAAFKLPDLFFTVVAGGALSTAFIPIFSRFLAQDDHHGAWQLASAITNLALLVVGLLSGLAMFFAPWLVQALIAPGFDVAQQAETVTNMRIVFISTIFFSVSAIQSSVLHGFKHFLLPALAPVVYPLGIILGAIWLAPTWGTSGLAWGAVIGAFLHLAIKIPLLLKYGIRWWPHLKLDNVAVRRVLVLMGPRVLDLGVFHLTLLATTNLASRLSAGSVSALEWGWEFMQLPETVIGTAFGLVVFPTLAELAARDDLAGLRKTVSESLQLLIALTVPAAVGLILLGQPLLQVVYQRGAFNAEATIAVNVALRYFALGLVGHVALEVVARTFFALEDTITPLLVAVGAGLCHVLLGLLLMQEMGHGGLALANSVAITVEVIVLMLLLRRRIGGTLLNSALRQIIQVSVRSLASAVVMGVAVLGVLLLTTSIHAQPLVTLISGIGIGGITYIVAGLFFRVPMVSDCADFVGGFDIRTKLR